VTDRTDTNRKPEGTPSDFTRERAIMHRILVRAAWFGGVILVVLYLSTAVAQVKVQETGILLRFGKIVRDRVDPGICIKWPWPIDRLETVKTRSIETLQAGFGSDPKEIGGGIRQFKRTGEKPAEGTLTVPYVITGDKNVLHLRVLVNYRINDPTTYRFRVADGAGLLTLLTQQTILEFVSQAHVDRLLTSGKVELRNVIQQRLNGVLTEAPLGVQVVSVEVRHVRPPGPTTQAFKDVINAQEESRETVHQAESYAKRMLPEARAKAKQIISEAQAYQTRTVTAAQGEAARFQLLATEYAQYPKVTRERLRQETIETLFPTLTKYVVGSSTTGPAANLRFMTGKPKR